MSYVYVVLMFSVIQRRHHRRRRAQRFRHNMRFMDLAHFSDPSCTCFVGLCHVISSRIKSNEMEIISITLCMIETTIDCITIPCHSVVFSDNVIPIPDNTIMISVNIHFVAKDCGIVALYRRREWSNHIFLTFCVQKKWK